MTTDHRIYTHDEDDNEHSYWECSCGCSGSSPSYNVDLHSDKHIKYDFGETRVDISKPNW